MSNTEQYAQYFTDGLKISVGIPMESNEIFRDWALVTGLEEDIITLQLSRDELPDGVHLVTGVILELRIGKEGKGYRCSGFFVSSHEAGKISVHLTGEVGTSELREFYRLDMFLPFRYTLSPTQGLDQALSEWRSRRQKRLADDAERKEQFEQKRRDRIFRTASGELAPALNGEQTAEEFNPIDDSWDTVNALAVNISAGGFKFTTSDHFAVDDLVFFEILIPGAPARIMDTVARVVFKNRNLSIRDGREYHNVAVQFILIDERDRDAVVQHISNIESMRIRMLRQIPLISYGTGSGGSPVRTFLFVSVLLLLALLTFFFIYSDVLDSNNDIQNAFQESLKRYREKFK